MPADPTPRSSSRRRPSARAVRLGLLATAALVLSACSFIDPPVVILSTVGAPADLPEPSCGGLKVLIEGALPCEQIAVIAVTTLNEMSSVDMRGGVTKIDVWLGDCPGGGLIPNLDCLGNPFAQFVTVTLGPAEAGGPIGRPPTVVVDPVTGQVLGIQRALP